MTEIVTTELLALRKRVEELEGALRPAQLWLKTLVDECDLDPEDTAYTVNAVSPEGKRTLARVTLASTQAQIAAALPTPKEPS